MTTTLTGKFASAAAARNAHEDLIDTGYPSEMVHLDTATAEVKVITSADTEREAREVLGRHKPTSLTDTAG
jgi:uncharacterized protein YggE